MAELSKRVADILKDAGIEPIEALDLSDEELLEIEGIGPSYLEEIREASSPVCKSCSGSGWEERGEIICKACKGTGRK